MALVAGITVPPDKGDDPVEGFLGAWGVEESGGMQRRKPNGRANAGSPRVPSDGSNNPVSVPHSKHLPHVISQHATIHTRYSTF